MVITINGRQKDLIQQASLKSIVEQFCKNSNRVIAELNGQVIRNNEWSQSILKDGDTLELVNFVGGG